MSLSADIREVWKRLAGSVVIDEWTVYEPGDVSFFSPASAMQGCKL